ncbi:hypothetical protein D3C80_1394000 [compost metagenome]
MHMRAGLALRVGAAGLVLVLLHRARQLAVLGHRQHAEAAARGRLHTVVGHEQVALVMAEAGMGRLVAGTTDLVEGFEAAVFGTDGKAAGLPLACTVLVDREQQTVVDRQGQPGRVFTLEHLQWLGIDLTAVTVERVTVEPFTGAIGVTAHQQLRAVGGGEHTHGTSDQQGLQLAFHRHPRPGRERHSYRLVDARCCRQRSANRRRLRGQRRSARE